MFEPQRRCFSKTLPSLVPWKWHKVQWWKTIPTARASPRSPGWISVLLWRRCLFTQMYYFYRAMGKIVYIYQFPLRPPRKRCTSQKAKNLIFELRSNSKKGGKPKRKKTHFFSWYLWGSGIFFIHAPEGKHESNQRSLWCFGSDADFPFHFGGPVCFRSPGLDGFPPMPGVSKRLILERVFRLHLFQG